MMVYPRKSTVKHNYAHVNLKGFNSTRSLRSRKHVNRIISSAPSSPCQAVNAKRPKVTKSNKSSKSNVGKEIELNKVAKKLLGLKDSELILSNGANVFVASSFKGSTNNNSPGVSVTPKHDKHVSRLVVLCLIRAQGASTLNKPTLW